MVSTLMASQSILLFPAPKTLLLQTPKTSTQFSPNFRPLSFSRETHFLRPLKITSSSVTSPPTTIVSTTNPKISSHSFLTGSTRTITTLFSLAFSLVKLVTPPPQTLTALSSSAGPLFFAAIKDRAALNTPLTVVAAGVSKWLDLYSGVLMVRVLLSWFPNIPWERQPLSAIRDLCDPYLNLFRNIIPPLFDTLDISPLLAFAVLGSMGALLNSTGGY